MYSAIILLCCLILQVLEQLEGPKMEQTTTKLGKAVGGSDVKKSLPTEARKVADQKKL